MLGGHVWFRPIPVAVTACLVLVVLVVLAVIDSARTRTWTRWLTALSVVAVLAVTLSGAPAGTGGSNLVPGRTIVAELTGFAPLGVFNVVGNVALFVPLGWLLALTTARRPLVVVAAVGFGLSASIEVVQSLIGRVSDIDDVILNGSGAVLGACLAQLIRAIGSASRGTASLGERSVD